MNELEKQAQDELVTSLREEITRLRNEREALWVEAWINAVDSIEDCVFSGDGEWPSINEWEAEARRRWEEREHGR